MKILKYGLLAGSVLILTGCVGQPSIAKIDDNEAFKYVKQYEAEYETIKKNLNYKDSIKWIQPKNKKEECKVYVDINPKDDKTVKADYSLFWDGECKDGYAYGLGREIENTMLQNLQQLGYYDKGKAVDYCVGFDPINNWEVNGECSYDINKPNHYVKTSVNDKNGEFQIGYEFGVNSSLYNPLMIMETYAFNDEIKYFKEYPNFSYRITDLTKNEFDKRNYVFDLINHKNGQINGFGFQITKQGITNAGEMVNGTFVRRVQLPQSYFDKANSILSEIKHHANIALEAQKKALIIKEKYKKKICQDSIKVDFMDNNEYKAICNENEKFAQLKTKIDAKLAQINQEKQLKRAQMGQERLIQAQEAQARAAQQQASAARAQANAVQQRADDSYWSDFNTNMQLMQLNNNLMMIK